MNRQHHITLKQLRAMALVAQHGTINAAAEMMALSPPAVHNQLKNLEEMIGTTLIHRDGRVDGRLTPQGEILLQAHREIDASLGRAFHNITALEAGQSGHVMIGAVNSAKYFAPRIVALLEQEFPQIDITMRVASRSKTIKGLEAGEFDLCIMGRPPRAPATDAQVLGTNPHVLIAPPDHPLVHKDHITADDVFAQRFVLREEGSSTRQITERLFARYGVAQTVQQIEMGGNETIKRAVMNRLGIACISAHSIVDELQMGRLVMLDFEGVPILRQWHLLTPSGFNEHPATMTIRNWMLENKTVFLPDPY